MRCSATDGLVEREGTSGKPLQNLERSIALLGFTQVNNDKEEDENFEDLNEFPAIVYSGATSGLVILYVVPPEDS